MPNNHVHTNGGVQAGAVRQPIEPLRLAQRDAAVLASEEGRATGNGPVLPNGHAHMNGDAYANGVAEPAGLNGHEGAIVLATDKGQAHQMMWGKHKFGERTHGGVQSRHYHAVKVVGAHADPVEALRLLVIQCPSVSIWGVGPGCRPQFASRKWQHVLLDA